MDTCLQAVPGYIYYFYKVSYPMLLAPVHGDVPRPVNMEFVIEQYNVSETLHTLDKVSETLPLRHFVICSTSVLWMLVNSQKVWCLIPEPYEARTLLGLDVFH